MPPKFPLSPPPPAVFPKLLPLLISQLSSTPINPTIVPALETSLYILRSQSLDFNTAERGNIKYEGGFVPLSKLLELSTSYPGSVSCAAIIDAILAYPLHAPVLNTIVSNVLRESPDSIEVWRVDIVPEVITKFRQGSLKEISIAARLLLGIIRGHDELMGVAMESVEDLLKGLSLAYAKLAEDGDIDERRKAEAKGNVLMACREMMLRAGTQAAKKSMLALLGNDTSQVRVMEGRSLRVDCEALLGLGTKLFSPSQSIVSALSDQRDEISKTDPRVQAVLALFPTIPAHLLLMAFSHPQFSNIPSGSKAKPGEHAEPLLACILNGGEDLAEELKELKDEIKKLGKDEFSGRVEERGKKVERRNIFSAEDMDVSKLRIKEDETGIPELKEAIPPQLRNSIQRLIQLQAEEEETRRRALADADLLSESDGDSDTINDAGEIPSRLRVSGGDSEDNAPVDAGDGNMKVTQRQTVKNTGEVAEQRRYEILRQLYLDDPGLFDRDGVTRRSDERKKLKETIGWDDSQIEGWRVMLERDTNKDAILEAHIDRMARKNRSRGPDYGASRDDPPHLRHRNPSDESDDNDDRPSHASSTRGRGGGRGGNKKGSRGHSNSARTRGHDRKMRQMGA